MSNMKVYKVMVTILFGVDDTYYCEYTGIEHYNRESAESELIQAQKEDGVIYASIVYEEHETIKRKAQ